MYLTTQQAIEILKNNGIVALPTETVYGLAALANSQEAVQKIYKAKDRPADNPLICIFYSYNQIKEYIPDISPAAEILIQHFSPGPISFLFSLPNNSSLNPAVARTNNIACRIPNHPITLQIVEQLDIPLAAPSANTSTKYSATNAKMVKDDLGDKIDGIVDGGESQIGLESTILDCRDPHKIIILRPGSIGKLELQQRLEYFDLDTIVIEYQQEEIAENIPGQKYQHYSPKTPITKITDYKNIAENQDIAILGTTTKLGKIELLLPDIKDIKFISLGDNPEEIAHNLYQKLYELDSVKVSKAYIIDFEFPDSSLLLAIQEKINRIVQKD